MTEISLLSLMQLLLLPPPFDTRQHNEQYV